MTLLDIKTKNKFCVTVFLFLIAILVFAVSQNFSKNFWLSAFLAIAMTSTLFYTIFGEAIFDWHADPNTVMVKKVSGTVEESWVDKRKELKDKEDLKKDAPAAWVIERYMHRFLGLILGWVFFWILLSRLRVFEGRIDFSNLGWPDLILFVAGWIGINGRLPTIAHDVQNWFARK